MPVPIYARAALLGISFAVRHLSRPLRGPAVLRGRQSLVRAGDVEKAWGFGTFKASGQLLDHDDDIFRDGTAEVDYPEVASGATGRNAGETLVRKHVPVYLVDNEIKSFDRLYINGEWVPVKEVTDPDDPRTTYWIADPAGFDDEIARLRTQLEALGTTYLNVDIYKRFPGTNAAVPAEAYEIYDRLTDLAERKRTFKWVYDIGAPRPPVPQPRKSLFRIYLDRNTAAERSNGSSADRQAAKRLGGAYDGTDSQNQGLAWAFVELYAFSENAEAFGGRIPDFQFVLTCPESNPARAFEWYMTTQCGVGADALYGVGAAAAISDQMVTYPSVSRGDESDDTKIVNSIDVWKVSYPWAVAEDGSLNQSLLNREVSTADQDRVLALWNSRFAGAGNARRRYTFNGLVTAGMGDDQSGLLAQFATAMAGDIATVSDDQGANYGYMVLAGAAVDPEDVTITDDDLVDDPESLPSWDVARSADVRVNAVTATVEQDRRNDYDPVVIRQVTSEFEGLPGYREQDIGAIPFKNDEMEARAIANVILRRRSPNLARVTFTLPPGDGFTNWLYRPGQRVRLRLGEWVGNYGLYRIESVRPDSRTYRVSITAIQDPDVIYSDRFDSMLATIGRGPRMATVAPTDDLRLSATAETVFQSVRDQAIACFLQADDPVSVSNPEYGRSPYGRPAGDGANPASTGDFEPRFIVHLHVSCGSAVRSVKVESAVLTANVFGISLPKLLGTQRFDLRPDEIEAPSLTRTLLDGEDVEYFDSRATRIIIVRLTGYANTGTDEADDPVAGPETLLHVSGRSGPAMGDLADYRSGSEVPTDGRVLAWRGGGWAPGETFKVFDEIPDTGLEQYRGMLLARRESEDA